MNKKSIILLSFLATSFLAIGQDRIPVQLRSTQWNINILQPSVNFEKSLTDNQSVAFDLGLTGLASSIGKEPQDAIAYSINPYLSGSFRNYYPRKRVQKELRANSGNYIGVITGYNFGAIADNQDSGTTELSNSFFLGPVWGIQRNYQSGIHFGLSLGPGFAVGQNTDLVFTGVGQFQLGFVIN